MSSEDLHVEERSPVPLWYQLRNVMLARIVSGIWGPGFQLPTEERLCEILGISRATVRAAIEALVRDGLIVRTRGKGSFITKAVTAEATYGALGFYRTMTAQGHAVRSKVLKSEVIPASEGLSRELNLHGDEMILHVRRLRYLDDSPAVLSDNFIVYRLCQGMENEDLTEGSLWERIEKKLKLKVAGGMHTFHAIIPSEEERQLLELAPNVPLLQSVGTNYLSDGTLMERADVKTPGDRSFLSVRCMSGSPSGGGPTFLSNL